MKKRFEALNYIVNLFGFLWSYLDISVTSLEEKCIFFSEIYDVSKPGCILALKRLKPVHSSNFCTEPLKPLVLLNKITKMKSPSFQIFQLLCEYF